MTNTPLAPSDAERAYVRGLNDAADLSEFIGHRHGKYAETGTGSQASRDTAMSVAGQKIATAIRALVGAPPDLTNPGNIPFGQLPRTTQEAMVISHVLDGAKINALEPVDGELMWLPLTFCKWFPKRIYRVVQP